ncbi:succinoglycan biosynthesis protein ExoU [Sphingomonas guangdongensis]|uniref:Succinoglycan biosynthesis protein ExoU n=1 Tax=Sphingomonas guangdongensis TaxID=1141890 RepID=A0A285QGR5_9SPHN|nr:glycosyltransferase [Sphingomonas guangdongensis]SOB81140.1 succinoglycan biosynthesis protein ExoU [Sphingomonas guangdongensis]
MSVAVLIAAKDAAATIGRSIASALAESQVSQVIVVDDGSADETARAARAADDASGRLIVERLAENRGPSAARNHALTLATADYVAVLDSDDIILPGRFARLLAVPEWDMIGDNILFVADGTDLDALAVPQPTTVVEALDLADFIEGCVQRRSRTRSQLGFLKPVIRRSLIAETGLGYDERIRLGEDFLLYVELLRRGACFLLTRSVGYVAVERATSLSARHRTADLAALLDAERALLAGLPRGTPAAEKMRSRIADTAGKHALRAFLDKKRADGLLPALAWLAERPRSWRAVIGGVARDKVTAALTERRPVPAPAAPRLLLPEQQTIVRG